MLYTQYVTLFKIIKLSLHCIYNIFRKLKYKKTNIYSQIYNLLLNIIICCRMVAYLKPIDLTVLYISRTIDRIILFLKIKIFKKGCSLFLFIYVYIYTILLTCSLSYLFLCLFIRWQSYIECKFCYDLSLSNRWVSLTCVQRYKHDSAPGT